MDRDGTGERAATEQPSRALVATEPARAEALPRKLGGRPMAGFLTQLMIGADAAMRTSRAERTRAAAAVYARAGVCRARSW